MGPIRFGALTLAKRMRDLGAGTQSRPDISWSSGVTAVVQWASALDNGNVIPKRRDASWLQDQEQRFLTKLPDEAIIVTGPSIGFSRHGEIFCDGTRTDAQIRPASCRCRPIAASFHRLFLGGLLPSRARFHFAGYAQGIRSILSRQAHANLHTERSPLDSAHIS